MAADPTRAASSPGRPPSRARSAGAPGAVRQLAQRVLAQPPRLVLALGPSGHDQEHRVALDQVEQPRRRATVDASAQCTSSRTRTTGPSAPSGRARRQTRLRSAAARPRTARRRLERSRPSHHRTQQLRLVGRGGDQPVAHGDAQRPVGQRLAVGHQRPSSQWPPASASNRERISATSRDLPIPASPEITRIPPDPPGPRRLPRRPARARARGRRCPSRRRANPARARRPSTGYAVTDSALPLRVRVRGSPHSKCSAIDFWVSAPTSTVPGSDAA